MDMVLMRRVPWTCEWGRFGVAAELVTATDSRVDELFWACHHPVLAPSVKALACGECDRCPMWSLAARFLVADLQ